MGECGATGPEINGAQTNHTYNSAGQAGHHQQAGRKVLPMTLIFRATICRRKNVYRKKVFLMPPIANGLKKLTQLQKKPVFNKKYGRVKFILPTYKYNLIKGKFLVRLKAFVSGAPDAFLRLLC